MTITNDKFYLGGMRGLAVRALAIHYCGPGLIPAWVICELSLKF